MKKLNLFFFILILIINKINASWYPIPNFGGGDREITLFFQANNSGYIGCGRSNGVEYNDLWEYNTSGVWTQKAIYPGNGKVSPGLFVINDSAYVVCGYGGSSTHNSVWCYLISTNIWIQKNNFPGIQRYSTTAFAINGKGYILTGFSGGGVLNDFWEYTPSSDTWIQLQNFPGLSRQHPSSTVVYGKAYFGLGYSSGYSFNDWWEYNPINSLWTQKTSFPGAARRGALAVNNSGIVVLGLGYDDYTYYNDFWNYYPNSNSWQIYDSLPAHARYGGAGFVINECIYAGTGSYNGIFNPIPLADMYCTCKEATGIEENNSDLFNIYFDNTINNLVINSSIDNRHNIKFILINEEGKNILSKELFLKNNSTSIDVSQISKGIYIYIATINNKVIKKGKILI